MSDTTSPALAPKTPDPANPAEPGAPAAAPAAHSGVRVTARVTTSSGTVAVPQQAGATPGLAVAGAGAPPAQAAAAVPSADAAATAAAATAQAAAGATAQAPRAGSGATARLREDLIHPDPLLDGLLELARLHGLSASRASLSAGLPLIDGRLTLALAERAAARAGMSAKLQRRKLDRIEPATLPALLILRGDEVCVLLGWSETGEARVLMPESGQGGVTMPREELEQRYTGVVLYARPHFRFDDRTPEVRAVKSGHWFWGAVLSQRHVYRDVLWAALLVNLFALALPMFTMNVYDRVVPNHAEETLWALAVGVCVVLTVDLVMRLLRSHFVDQASARIDVQISATLMERVLGMRMANRPQSVGSFASNLRGFEQVRDFIAASTVTTLIDLPFALLFLGVMAWISPLLALPVAVAFVLILVFGTVMQQRLHELSQQTYQAAALRNATLVESLTGIETIKSQGAESAIQARWERTNAFLSTLNVKMRSVSNKASYTTAWMQQVVSVAVVVIGVYLIAGRDLTMGALIACSMLSSRAMAPAGQIVGLLLQYQGARTALESLDKVMLQPVEREAGEALVHRREFSGEIEFRNVKFAYPEHKDFALDGVSFKIRPGDRVALIGRVGSGKSTIEKLILGLHQPSEGAVLIDGIDVRQLDPADLRRNVGYVSQDVMLFYGTLRENIAFGLPYADDTAIVAAAETAGLADFINRHPRGFDMQVGERGEMLSGGQRQSVGIARALLHNAPVLLLDEPTSAMDFSTEAQVTQRISHFAKGKTVVLVTHRTSMLSLVNRVIVIDNGKVVADGPSERILEALQAGRIAKAA